MTVLLSFSYHLFQFPPRRESLFNSGFDSQRRREFPLSVSTFRNFSLIAVLQQPSERSNDTKAGIDERVSGEHDIHAASRKPAENINSASPFGNSVLHKQLAVLSCTISLRTPPLPIPSHLSLLWQREADRFPFKTSFPIPQTFVESCHMFLKYFPPDRFRVLRRI